MYSETLKSLSRILALACVACLPVAMAAQDTATPAKNAPAADYSASKWDIFAGYSYLAPKGTVDTLLPNGNTVGFNYRAIDTGAIFSVARYFNKYVGAEAIGDVHPGPNDDFNGGSAGLIFRYPNADMTPFVHGLVGGERIGGPHYQADTWGVALTAGGGLDYNTPWFNHHLAIRVFQADYQYMHANFGPVVFGGRANINAARLSAGLVYHIGSFAPPPPVTLACSASPTSVFPGDPVALTATAGMLNPKLNAIYTWSGDGVTGNGTTATVNTTSLAPGTYTVKCGVKEGKPGKEGLKPWESADSSASFTVKEFEPPTISCSSNPSTIKPGETSAITAMGMSPQNRPLTYSYSAASGTVEGTGATATFSSTGAPTGPVGITCKVADDKGHTVSADTSVTIVAPPPPPVPHVEALCTITFDTDTKRPTRVNNEAKACLDEVALDLQKQADAKAVIVGDSTAKEKTPPKHHRRHAEVVDFAAQRAVNAKAYLVDEKGIDAARISVATGAEDSQKAANYLVPAGADFSADVQGTTAVDESAVKPEVRKPLAERHHHHPMMKMRQSVKPPVTQ